MTRLIRCDHVSIGPAPGDTAPCSATIDDGRNPAIDLTGMAQGQGWRYRTVSTYDVMHLCPEHAGDADPDHVRWDNLRDPHLYTRRQAP